MGLHIHGADRADVLADALGGHLAVPPEDPFEQDVVVVPARGVERWLAQHLSHRLGVGPRGGDGICAGIRFLAPASLVAMLTGTEHENPWEPDRLVWPLLSAIDAHLEDPWCAILAAHLGHGRADEEGQVRAGRRYSVARRLAGLYADYALQRLPLLRDWRAGRDTDGLGGRLDDDLCWQAELWRRLLPVVGAEPPDVRHDRVVAELAAGTADPDLPRRLSLFGHTRLAVTDVELLAALGRHRQVHLWLPQASPRLWDRLGPAAAAGPVPRRADPTGELVGHPLLASLGRDARELRRVLAAAGGAETDAATAGRDRAPEAIRTRLGWLHHDLRRNAAPSPQERAARAVAPGDASVQVHACHGPARQIDVLREILVGLLDDDPTLQPRDVLVMCPDVEAYAPLVQAGFGLGDLGDGGGRAHPAHRLRVRIADRSPASTNALFDVAARLVALAGGRAGVGELLDLAATAPVRRRFAFDEQDLARMGRWAEQAAIRWGFDAAHRAGYHLGQYGQNTWRFGLDRLLLGAAMPQEGHRRVGATLPVDDVAGADLDLLGRFAEFVDRVHSVVEAFETATTADAWLDGLAAGARAIAEVGPSQAWQSAQLDRELAGIAAAADPGVALRLGDVRRLLADRLAARPTRANFRTGTLTVCTMVPMRSVPHRVVCLVGLDDGVFPRTPAFDGDDVLARDPVTGERDPRSEDRQLLLDAIMAATDTLVVTYTGAAEHTGAARPPAVPLGELLETLDRTTSEGFAPVRHPLQPFDALNFAPGAITGALPFSFDAVALAGARRAARPRVPEPPFLAGPLPAPARSDVTLADLLRFFAHPAREFLRARLGIEVPADEDETDEAMPVELAGLQKWAVGDRLLSAGLAGVEPRSGRGAERLRGLVPPRALGDLVLDEVGSIVDGLLTASADLRTTPERALDVDVDLGGGRRLTGTAAGVRAHRVVAVTYSSVRARQRLDSWITLLALAAGHPQTSWTAHVVGRGRGRRARHVISGPVPAERARRLLAGLVDLRDRGLREPVPLPIRTGHAYAEALLRGHADDPLHPPEEAVQEWVTNRDRAAGVPGEQEDAAHVRVYGAAPPLSVLLAEPRADEGFGPGATRLGRYALAVWEPVLAGGQREA